jgi:hypothetical protein
MSTFNRIERCVEKNLAATQWIDRIDEERHLRKGGPRLFQDFELWELVVPLGHIAKLGTETRVITTPQMREP